MLKIENIFGEYKYNMIVRIIIGNLSIIDGSIVYCCKQEIGMHIMNGEMI